MSMSDARDLRATVGVMNEKFSGGLSQAQIQSFNDNEMFGVPMRHMKNHLELSSDRRTPDMVQYGIPTDSIEGGMSEFKLWG
jgi:hypothetical protein